MINEHFFKEMEKNALNIYFHTPTLDKIIEHRKPILGGLAALVALNILGPKLYTYFNEREKRKIMEGQKGLLENIAMTNSYMATPKVSFEPKKDEYNYV